MAATDARLAGGLGSVVIAALALPGTAPAQVESGPGSGGFVALRWLGYRDAQPGLQRITVNAPVLALRVPHGDEWAWEAELGHEAVSGASPRYHTAIAGASRMTERRRHGEVRVTRYARAAQWSVGAGSSRERDFESDGLTGRVGWESEDRNRTLSVEGSWRRDRIGSVNDPNLQERRRTAQVAVTATQALSRRDSVQLQLGHTVGRGFHTDPYKLPDTRPSSRHQSVLALRWNHHLDGPDVALRLRYRHYRDSFGVRSHTVGVEPAWQVTPRVELTPSLRLYSQSAASFYYNPRFAYVGIPFPDGEPPAFISADQRLAAFGAVTLGLAMGVELGGGWRVDLSLERYEQRTAWHWRTPGSRGLAPLSARFVQAGVTRRF